MSACLALLMIGGALLRLYSCSDPYLHSWDERYHALVAKNMINHPLTPTLYKDPVLPYNYTEWYSNHYWLHKQPFPLWCMSFSMQVFGVSVWSMRLPTFLLSLIAIALTFYLGKFLFNKQVGYIAGVLMSLNGLIIELTGGRVATDHYDIFYMVLIESSVFFLLLYRNTLKLYLLIVSGIMLGFAILTKWLPALIVFVIWIPLLFEWNRANWKKVAPKFALFALTSAVIFIPWQLYASRQFPLEYSWEMKYNAMHYTQILEGQSGPWYFYLQHLLMNYGELSIIAIAYLFYKLKTRLRSLYIIGLWVIIPILFFSFAKTKMQGYLVFTAPALFILIAYFINDIKPTIKHWRYPNLYNGLFILFVFLLPMRYAIDREKVLVKGEADNEWVDDLRNLPDYSHKNVIMFNYPKPIDAMFFTDFTVYRQVPAQQMIDSLVNTGHMVILAKNTDSNDSFDEYNNCKVVDLKFPSDTR